MRTDRVERRQALSKAARHFELVEAIAKDATVAERYLKERMMGKAKVRSRKLRRLCEEFLNKHRTAYEPVGGRQYQEGFEYEEAHVAGVTMTVHGPEWWRLW